MKVLIAYDEKYTKQHIINDLVAEGFHHEYMFAVDLNIDGIRSALLEADEIWTFGNCTQQVVVGLAKEYGVDTWQMG